MMQYSGYNIIMNRLKAYTFDNSMMTIDDAFFNRNWAGVRGVAGLDPDCWRAGMQAFRLPGL